MNFGDPILFRDRDVTWLKPGTKRENEGELQHVLGQSTALCKALEDLTVDFLIDGHSIRVVYAEDDLIAFTTGDPQIFEDRLASRNIPLHKVCLCQGSKEPRNRNIEQQP